MFEIDPCGRMLNRPIRLYEMEKCLTRRAISPE
jgi:hypothetical protein